MTKDETTLEVIYNCLQESAKYGLQSEVVFFAILAMKTDPDMLISEAMLEGFNEWIK